MEKEMENTGKKSMKDMTTAELRNEIIKRQSLQTINVDKKDANMKQILYNQTGYAQPGQVLGIMGASGSGKTSLLNIFGQRLDLSA